MLSEETLKKFFDAVILSNYSPGEMGWLWKEFLAHKNILDEGVEKQIREADMIGVGKGYLSAKRDAEIKNLKNQW